MHDLEATIVAVATPPGRGGIGCVRISGQDASAIARLLFRPARQGTRDGAPRFGTFLMRDGQPIDHGYLVEFPSRGAFSGEPTSELWSHGSPAVLAELVAAALAAGARAAAPGEFTYRALRHGRLDLARAEAVRDLIDARTVYQARVAFAQAEGALSDRLRPLRELLEEEIVRCEAAIEFVDEPETRADAGRLERGLSRARAMCRDLLAAFRAGRVVRDGASIAIVGRPNVGKSSLFNALLARDRAIVTEAAGTTRDLLEEQVDLDGVPARLIDTAGIREPGDRVEAEGVERAHRARSEADLVLFVLDGSREPESDEREAMASFGAEHGRTILAWNKCDLVPTRATPPAARRVSARTGEGLAALRSDLRGALFGREAVEDPILTNARHAHELERAAAALDRALDAAAAGLSDEIVVEDLREAMRHVGAITGEFTHEELYDGIFSTFCIGK